MPLSLRSTRTASLLMKCWRSIFGDSVSGERIHGERRTRQRMAHVGAYASTPTEQLYDRREDCVTLDEVLKINVRG